MPSFEQAYYEADALWDPQNTRPSDLERVGHVLSRIAPEADSLLDVGCGNGICCNRAAEQLPHLERVVGFDRSLAALQHVTVEKHSGQIGDLPFADGEFFTCVALEVLEHLPAPCFEAAVHEIARVSRRQIIVTVPNHENLRRNVAECPSCHTRFNRALHMRSFTRGGLMDLFREDGFACEECVVIGRRQPIGYPSLVEAVRAIRGQRLAMRHAVCPVCGFEGRAYDQLGRSRQPSSPLRRAVRRLWPKVPSRQWLLAVYARN